MSEMNEQSGQQRPRLTNQLDYIKKNVLPNIRKHKHSWPFQRPVNPVELGLPDYFDVVKRPMDLSTIKKKIDRNEYSGGSEALADFELMFSNCYLYNKPTDDVTLMCQEVESFFKSLVKKVPEPEVDIAPPEPAASKSKPAAKVQPKNAKKPRPPPTTQKTENVETQPEEGNRRLNPGLLAQPEQPILKQGRRGIKRPDTTLPENDKKRARKRKRWWSGCKQFVDFLFMKKNEKFAFPFYEPVDHVKLKLTDYTKIIKTPMDMGTIRKKLESDQYAEYGDVWRDLKLMFDNCYLYNPQTDNIVKLARTLEAMAEKRWKELVDCMSESEGEESPEYECKSSPSTSTETVTRPSVL